MGSSVMLNFTFRKRGEKKILILKDSYLAFSSEFTVHIGGEAGVFNSAFQCTAQV